MKITDIIRKVLDVIDQAEEPAKPDGPTVDVEINVDDPYNDEVRRMKQIAGLLPTEHPVIANAPNEKYADIDAVTVDAGGGPNGPKHPADMKANSISMYPNQQRF